MLLETTKFGSVDILLSLGASLVATKWAVGTPSYRLSLSNKMDTPYIGDLRFIFGSLGFLASQLYIKSEAVRRPIMDVSFGLLSSLFSTEVVRARAMERLQTVGTTSISETRETDLQKDPFIMGYSEDTLSHGYFDA